MLFKALEQHEDLNQLISKPASITDWPNEDLEVELNDIIANEQAEKQLEELSLFTLYFSFLPQIYPLCGLIMIFWQGFETSPHLHRSLRSAPCALWPPWHQFTNQKEVSAGQAMRWCELLCEVYEGDVLCVMSSLGSEYAKTFENKPMSTLGLNKGPLRYYLTCCLKFCFDVLRTDTNDFNQNSDQIK